MLEIAIRRVREEQVDRLRAWMSELNDRLDEVRWTFRQETVRHEAAYLVRGEEGPILVYAIDAEDPQVGHEVAAASTLPIDIEHREVMRSVLSGPAEAELLYECRLDD
jgi:hypothetical protein